MKAFSRLLVVMFLPAAWPLRAAEAAASTPPQFHVTGALPLEGFSGIGTMFVRNNRLDQLGWTPEQINAFTDGVRAAMLGKGYPLNEATRLVGADMVQRIQQAGATHKPAVPDGFDQPDKLAAYLKDMRKRLHMQEADSGLLYSMKMVGRGMRPAPADTVIVTLVGMDHKGTEALPELSGENVRIKVADLLPGLREGVQMMAVGSEAIFVLSPPLSFGSGDWPVGVGPGVPLTFSVTLHEVISAAAPP